MERGIWWKVGALVVLVGAIIWMALVALRSRSENEEAKFQQQLADAAVDRVRTDREISELEKRIEQWEELLDGTSTRSGEERARHELRKMRKELDELRAGRK